MSPQTHQQFVGPEKAETKCLARGAMERFRGLRPRHTTPRRNQTNPSTVHVPQCIEPSAAHLPLGEESKHGPGGDIGHGAGRMTVRAASGRCVPHTRASPQFDCPIPLCHFPSLLHRPVKDDRHAVVRHEEWTGTRARFCTTSIPALLQASRPPRSVPSQTRRGPTSVVGRGFVRS